MPIIDKQIKIKWASSNKQYYIEKGYTFTKMNDEFHVSIQDLRPTSHQLVKCECNYCGAIIFKEYRRCSNNINDICCGKCQPKKNKKVLLNKYGVENISQLQETKDKVKQTNLERWGVENISQSELIKEKKVQSSINKYGTRNVLQSDEVKEKCKQTCRERYGVDHHMLSKDYKIKFENNNLKKYGYKYPFQSSEVQNKIAINRAKTMYKNGTAACSKQQRYIYDLLINNGFECELNYPVDRCLLDIAFPKENIYIEYDGGGHDLRIKHGMSVEEFNQREMNRQYYLKSLGWKLIRIKCLSDQLPDNKTIIYLIKVAKEYLLNSDHSWYKIDIDNNTIKYSDKI